MAVDYTELAAIATELIADNGRDVVLTKKSRTISDPAKPWRGNSITPVGTVTVKAIVFDVTDEQLSIEGDTGTDERNRDLILRGDKQALIAESSLAAAIAKDLVGYDTFTDGTQIYQIVNVETVKPGPTTIVYIMTLRI